MQISTRADDYIIDALALRSHLGAALAGPFADPQVLKVLHGADRDIEWLQKDFGLFVVNLFDTGRAARILDLPCGLGKLLNHFCNVSVRTSVLLWYCGVLWAGSSTAVAVTCPAVVRMAVVFLKRCGSVSLDSVQTLPTEACQYLSR